MGVEIPASLDAVRIRRRQPAPHVRPAGRAKAASGSHLHQPRPTTAERDRGRRTSKLGWRNRHLRLPGRRLRLADGDKKAEVRGRLFLDEALQAWSQPARRHLHCPRARPGGRRILRPRHANFGVDISQPHSASPAVRRPRCADLNGARVSARRAQSPWTPCTCWAHGSPDPRGPGRAASAVRPWARDCRRWGPPSRHTRYRSTDERVEREPSW